MTINQPKEVNVPKLDIESIRRDFPILAQHINGHPLAFLDSAASSQRPRRVIDAISEYYEHDHANVHRGIHTLSHRATDAYEGAREKVRRFINAKSTQESSLQRGQQILSTLWRRAWVEVFRPQMKLSLPTWSTTPTLFHGRCSRNKPA